MASTSGCSQKLNDLRLSDTSPTMGDSSETLDFASTTPTGGCRRRRRRQRHHAIPLTTYFSAVEDQIKPSKAHWSTLTDHLVDTDEEEVDFEVSNEQEFQALQRHPTWGSFFVKISGDGKSTSLDDVLSELVVGKKFAEGGQAELYEVEIKWNHRIKDPRFAGYECVLKVFKEGTLLKHVMSMLPQGLLQLHAEIMDDSVSRRSKVIMEHISWAKFGILLKGGRFAFLMRRQHFDLRTLIERNMKLKRGEECGPFEASKEKAPLLMYQVALGVDCLHKRDIVHRDLKASNVLVYEVMEDYFPRWNCVVADYECSIGVVGTNFFRAPEILQACKERKVNVRPEVFSRGADVYSYGMTCYEILTGKLPFEDHPLRDSPGSLLIDLVINQHLRPEVPTYVEDWTCELLGGCWQFDPTRRPRIREILNVLLANSREVRRFEVLRRKMQQDFEDTYR